MTTIHEILALAAKADLCVSEDWKAHIMIGRLVMAIGPLIAVAKAATAIYDESVRRGGKHNLTAEGLALERSLSALAAVELP